MHQPAVVDAEYYCSPLFARAAQGFSVKEEEEGQESLHASRK